MSEPVCKMFNKVVPGQKFIDLKSDQLCRKLFGGYVVFLDTDKELKKNAIGKIKSEAEDLVLKTGIVYNAIVDSTGTLTHISSEQQVQVFL